jgi:hypothetical protein
MKMRVTPEEKATRITMEKMLHWHRELEMSEVAEESAVVVMKMKMKSEELVKMTQLASKMTMTMTTATILTTEDQMMEV